MTQRLSAAGVRFVEICHPGDGRDHNINGYPMWLAGGLVKAGYSHGATDEFARHAVEGRMHTMDLHAMLLALMGLAHQRLTYNYADRNFRLTGCIGPSP